MRIYSGPTERRDGQVFARTANLDQAQTTGSSLNRLQVYFDYDLFAKFAILSN